MARGLAAMIETANMALDRNKMRKQAIVYISHCAFDTDTKS
jgi:hypothetical protein